ncbi:hypothetical protein VSVS12_02818 [Vibrio scophthalmi]|nr:hypothetical protein VSVS12_02818 [Vibrio scophthalmi]
MSFAVLILFALFINQINRLPLTRGAFSLKVTFWGFGVLGSVLLYGVSIGYFMDKLDAVTLEYQVNSALTTTLSVWPVYAYMALCGIWNASKDSGMLAKLVTRYFSIFFVSIIIGCAFILKFQYLAAFIIILIMRKQRAQSLPA